MLFISNNSGGFVYVCIAKSRDCDHLPLNVRDVTVTEVLVFYFYFFQNQHRC